MTGEAQPPGYYKQSFLCEAFRILNSNHTMLTDTIERSEQCRQNIESLSKRLEIFGESLVLQCKEAIDSSAEIIGEYTKYKLFNKQLDPMYLPNDFRAQYKEHQDYLEESASQILIEIDLPTNNDNSQTLCDRLETLSVDSNSDISGRQDCQLFNTETVINSTDQDVVMKLPPPLCPEIINTPSTDISNNSNNGKP